MDVWAAQSYLINGCEGGAVTSRQQSQLADYRALRSQESRISTTRRHARPPRAAQSSAGSKQRPTPQLSSICKVRMALLRLPVQAYCQAWCVDHHQGLCRRFKHLLSCMRALCGFRCREYVVKQGPKCQLGLLSASIAGQEMTLALAELQVTPCCVPRHLRTRRRRW